MAWISSGFPDPSSSKLDTDTGGGVTDSRIFPLSRTGISPTVGEEGEDEEDEEEGLSCFIGVRKVDEDADDELGQAWNHHKNEVLRNCKLSESRL